MLIKKLIVDEELGENVAVGLAWEVMKIISFKSTPENFYKELEGIKPCTFRFTDDWGVDRWELYREATHIEIVRTGQNPLRFKRKITDKTLWRNVACISWRHPK